MDGELKITAKFLEGTVEISQFYDVKKVAARRICNVGPRPKLERRAAVARVSRRSKRGSPAPPG